MRAGSNNHLVGQTGEALVASEFGRQGHTVGFLTGNAKDIDLLAYKGGQQIAVQVKTIASGALQVNLSKFVDIETKEDNTQVIHGPKSDLDENICFVAVFLGECLGADRFYVASIASFVDLLTEHHRGYLAKNHGMRPGKNKGSTHAAITEVMLKKDQRFVTLGEYLESH